MPVLPPSLLVWAMYFRRPVGPHVHGLEYGHYKVEDGKVVEEFFYAAPTPLA